MPVLVFLKRKIGLESVEVHVSYYKSPPTCAFQHLTSGPAGKRANHFATWFLKNMAVSLV